METTKPGVNLGGRQKLNITDQWNLKNWDVGVWSGINWLGAGISGKLM